jgi:hypothetical protein
MTRIKNRLISIALLFIFVISCNVAEAAVNSSSNEEGFKPEFAFDSDMTTRWSSNFTDDEWLIIDIGLEQEIVGLILYWEAAYAQSYEVLLSADKENWRSVYKIDDSDGSIDDIYFGRRKARYIKIKGVKRATAWGYSLWEVEILGLDKEIKIGASSHLGNYEPQKALDADYSTKWYTKAKDAALVLEFIKPVNLGGLEIIWDDNYPLAYDIKTSVDGLNWQTVATNDNCTGGRELMSFNLINKRFINISCRENDNREGFGIIEIKPKKWQELAESSKLNMIRGLSGDIGIPYKVYCGRDGSYQALPHNFKLLYFLYDHQTDTLYTPQTLPTTWRLEDGGYPVNIVTWQADELSAESMLFSRWFSDVENLLSFYSISLKNKAENKRDLSLFLIIQKSELAKEDLKEIRLNDKNFIMVDGQAAVYLKDKDFLLKEDISDSGLNNFIDKKAGVFEYRFSLESMEEKKFKMITPSARKEKNISLSKIKSLDFNEELIALEKYLDKAVPMKINLPDKRFRDCFYSSVYYILLCMDGYDLHPGPYNYREFTLHDSVGLAAALDRAGLHDTVSKAMDYFKFNKGKDEGYLDGLGGNIYILYDHYLFTKDKGYLESVYPQMKELAYYIAEIRKPQLIDDLKNTALYGLLPASCSQDNFKYPAHLYVDNWWALCGLKSASKAALILNETEDARFYNDEYENLKKCLLESIDKAMDNNKTDYMPAFADDWPKEMRVVDLDHRILGETQMAWAHRPATFPGDALGITIPEGLFKRSYMHYWNKTGSFSNYDGGWFVEYERLFWGYNGKISHPCIYLDMEDISYKSLLWMVEHQSCPGGWMEAMPTTKNEKGFYEISEGIVGDVPHTWSAAHYLLHLRNIILREKADKLILFSAIPKDWLDNGNVIEVKNAATYFGPIDIHLRSHISDKYLKLSIASATPPEGGYLVKLPLDNIEKVEGQAEAKITKDGIFLSNKAKDIKIYLK